jgi:hypothetical protein
MGFVNAVTRKETEGITGRQRRNISKPRDNKAIIPTWRTEFVKVIK